MEASGSMSRPALGCTSTPSWTSPLLSTAVYGLPSRSARPPSGPPAGCLLWLPAGGLPAQGELPTQHHHHLTLLTNPGTPGTMYLLIPPKHAPPSPSPKLDSSPLLCLASAPLTDPSTPLSQSTNPELPPRLGPVPSGLPQKGTQVRGVKAGPRSVEGEQC